jgi:hypothetical protein
LTHSRLLYRRLAQQVASEIQDYVESGYQVAGAVGVDGSPTCGGSATLRMGHALNRLACLRADEVTRDDIDSCVRPSATQGSGLFISDLRSELRRPGEALHSSAYDLIAELEAVRIRQTPCTPEEEIMKEQMNRAQRRRDYFVGGLGLGLALGLLYGMVLGNPAMGLVFGVAIGVVLGLALRQGVTL